MLKKFLIHLLKYAPSRLLPALTGLISIPIISRLFLPVEYGNYALAISLCYLLYAVACSGLGSGAVRFYPEYEERSELDRYFMALNFDILLTVGGVSILSLLVLSFIKGFISQTLSELLYISILVFIAQAIFIIYLEILTAREKSGTYSVFNLVARYGALGLGLFLVLYFGSGIDGLLWGEFLCMSVAVPILIYVVSKGNAIRWKSFSFKDSKHMLSYAWPLGLGNMAMWGLNLSDRWIIGIYRPGSEIGLYSMAYQISDRSINIVVAVFLLGLYPLIFNRWQSHGRKSAEEVLRTGSRVFLIFCLPACIGLTILAKPIVRILTTEVYFEGYRIVGYVAFSAFFWGLSQIASTGLLLGKRTRVISLNQFVATAVNLGLNFLLVPKFGFVAAGITTLLGFAILFALQTYHSREKLTWFFPFKTLLSSLLASGFMAVTAYSVIGFANSSSISQITFLLIAIMLSIIVYFISLLLIGEFKDDIEVINALKPLRQIAIFSASKK